MYIFFERAVDNRFDRTFQNRTIQRSACKYNKLMLSQYLLYDPQHTGKSQDNSGGKCEERQMAATNQKLSTTFSCFVGMKDLKFLLKFDQLLYERFGEGCCCCMRFLHLLEGFYKHGLWDFLVTGSKSWSSSATAPHVFNLSMFNPHLVSYTRYV